MGHTVPAQWLEIDDHTVAELATETERSDYALWFMFFVPAFGSHDKEVTTYWSF